MLSVDPTQILESDDPAAALAALSWLLEAGVDEGVLDQPINRYESAAAQAEKDAQRQKRARPGTPGSGNNAQPSAAGGAYDPNTAPPVWTPEAEAPQSLDGILAEARDAAAEATTLDELHDAIRAFNGCALKKTAKNTVVYRGNTAAKVMVIGEAPGRDEDLQGVPFSGKSGKLLDAMFAAIGLTPDDLYISNVLFWRPPGDRPPGRKEVLLCQPFVQRQIELLAPDHLILLGGISTKSLLGEQQTIAKLRGSWRHYQSDKLPAPLPALPLFNPVFLLKQPAQKRETWMDLLALKRVLSGEEEPKIKGTKGKT
ncbi:uracil-DNA glycosylase [Rhodovibrionaceae bacterium A322]